MAWFGFGRKRAEIAELRSELAETQRAIGGLPWETNPAVPFGQGGPAHPSQIASGIDGGLRLAPLYAAVRLLADSVASLPIQIYIGANSQEQATRWNGPSIFDHPSAFPNTSPYDWLFQCMTSLLLQGNAFGYCATRDAYGFPTTIEWLAPSEIWIDEDDSADLPNPMAAQYYYRGRHIPVEDMFHIRAFTIPGRVRGISPLKSFMNTIAQGTSMTQYSSDWFSNGGFPPGIFRNINQEIDPEQGEEIKGNLSRSLRSRRPLVIGADWEYCLTPDHQMLTKRGWLSYDEIHQDDQCLSLNPDTGMSEWQPVESVHVFDGPHNVTEMSSTTHSSVTTARHRWPVVKRKSGLTGWTTTATMARDDRVWRAAPVVAPAEAKWSDALVELVAWLWTEGHVRENGMVEIEQSQAVNPQHVARIRAALTELFGPAVESLRHGRETLPRPAWREDKHGPMARFRLSGKAGRVLSEHAPGKVVRTEWLAELTRAQLELFIQASVDADGETRPNGTRRLSQRDRARVDAFQVACALAGYAGSVRCSARGFWWLEIGRRPWCKPAQPQNITHRQFDGIVWCPTTKYGNWFCRRNGTTYFTGNTPVKVPPNEAQFVETVRLNASQIAAVYGVPPERIGGSRGDSLTYSNQEFNAISFVQDTLRPWLVRLENAFFRITPASRYVRFNSDALIKADIKTRHEVFQIDRNMGLKSLDELRNIDDLEPLANGMGTDHLPLIISTELARAAAGIPTIYKDEITVLEVAPGATPGAPASSASETPQADEQSKTGLPDVKPGGTNGSKPAASTAKPAAAKPASSGRAADGLAPPKRAPAQKRKPLLVRSLDDAAREWWAPGAPRVVSPPAAFRGEAVMCARRGGIQFRSFDERCMDEDQYLWLVSALRALPRPAEIWDDVPGYDKINSNGNSPAGVG